MIATISSTLKPSMACRMKASRGPEPEVAQRGRDQAQQFIGSHDLLGRGDAGVGNYGRAGDGFVGLMKLQFRFVAALHVAAAGGIFQGHRVAVAFVRCESSSSARRARR